MDIDRSPILAEARTCLVFQLTTRLVSTALPCWSDGVRLWLPPVPANGPAAVWSWSARPPDPAVVGWGDIRRFGAGDPLGLLLHSPALAGAVAGLALRHGVRGVPALADGVARMTISRLRGVDVPVGGDGGGPALPARVPPDVRRAVGPPVRAVLAFPSGGDIHLEPVTVGRQWELRSRQRPAAGAPVLVVVEAAGPDLAGIALEGALDADGRFAATRVRWWGRGGEGEDRVGGPGVVLPD